MAFRNEKNKEWQTLERRKKSLSNGRGIMGGRRGCSQHEYLRRPYERTYFISFN